MSEMVISYYSSKTMLASEFLSSTDEAGAFIPIRHEGRIIMTSPEQQWFWTEEWQAGELEVDDFIKAGNIQSFDSMEEFLRTLRE